MGVFWNFIKRKKFFSQNKFILFGAALLHDLGHGPLSHTSEVIFSHNHEYWSKNLVENYVLEDFNNNEKLVLDKLIKNICKNFYLLIENNPQKFISDLSEKQFTSLK